jgi:hypothetical protein
MVRIIRDTLLQQAAAAAATEQEMSTDDESETEEDVSASMPLADPFDLVLSISLVI